jgi:uncharacterized protein (TIGR00369 family)
MTLDELRRFFGAAPFVADLGVEPVAFADGRLATGLAVVPRHLQHTGSVHAGVMATMADHSMGIAAQAQLGEGRWILTAELKTSLLRPAIGQRLHCEAWVLKPGRSLCFTEAEVWVEAEGRRTLVMKASATMAVVAADRLATTPERT